MSLKAHNGYPMPAISAALLEYLQSVFPNTLPEKPVSTEVLGVLIGQQKVINHLRAQFDFQSRTVIQQP